MKKLIVSMLAVCAIAAGTVGCKKEESIDTAGLQSAFASAPAEIKEKVDQAVAAVNANDYRQAISLLDTVLTKTNEMTTAQAEAAGRAFAAANAISMTRGTAASANEASANKSQLEGQAKGSE